MNRPDDLYRDLADWMSDGPSVVAGRVIDGALTTIDHTPQVRRPRVPWRLSTMPFSYRLALVAMLVIAGIGSTLVVGRLTSDQAAGRQIIVAQDGSGDARTIAEALELAADGDTVLVRPGTYAESLTITKDITLRGDGDPSAIVIDFSVGDAGPITQMPGVGDALPSLPYGIVLDGSDATIAELTVHASYPGAAFKIVGGAPTIEAVSITAEQPSFGPGDDQRTSFGIYEESTATIRDSSWDGYVKVDRSSPLFEHDTISAGNGQYSSWLTVDFAGSAPVIRANTFLGGASVALCCGARGTIEDNDVVGGFLSAQAEADVVIRGNRIRATGEAECEQCDTLGIGIGQLEGSQGSPDAWPLVEGNEVSGMDVGIQADGAGVNAVVRGNTLVANDTGVLLNGTAGGDISDNTIRDGRVGLVISIGSAATVSGNTVESNERGIAVAKGAQPGFSGNAACGNGIDLLVAGQPVTELEGVTVCTSPSAASTAP